MRKTKKPRVDNLLIDVVEYAFIEWLVREKAFTAFRANYDRTPTTERTFRDCLRDHIRSVFRNPSLGPGALVSSSFLFTSAPEGFEYWLNLSEAWKHFYSSFQLKH